MGKSAPAAPTPPNLAEATEEGIYTDIETLPTRRLIEQAARMGKIGPCSNFAGQDHKTWSKNNSLKNFFFSFYAA